MNFVGPEEEIASLRARCGDEGAVEEGESGERAGDEGVGEAAGVDDTGAMEAVEESLCVDEETFNLWLESSEFSFGRAVRRWWAGLGSCEEEAVEGILDVPPDGGHPPGEPPAEELGAPPPLAAEPGDPPPPLAAAPGDPVAPDEGAPAAEAAASSGPRRVRKPLCRTKVWKWIVVT